MLDRKAVTTKRNRAKRKEVHMIKIQISLPDLRELSWSEEGHTNLVGHRLREEFEAGFVDNFGKKRRKVFFAQKTEGHLLDSTGEYPFFVELGKTYNVYLELLREFIKKEKNDQKLQRVGLLNIYINQHFVSYEKGRTNG